MQKKFREAAIAWARKSQSKERINAMVILAQTQCAASIEDFDQNCFALNLQNCVLDLKTGQTVPHDMDGMHSKIASVHYQKDADCPLFKKFLSTIFRGDPMLIAYWQRVMGYALTGDIREQCLFVLVGDGRNGKSTLLGIFADIMGDYHCTANMNTFLDGNKSSIRSDLARLKGARVVTASEANEGQAWDESLLKHVTGGERITARPLYQNEFEFLPQFKILTGVNVMPIVRGIDMGIWRRMKIIPFDHVIAEEDVDPQLLEKLKQEKPGILNFALEGLREWQQRGLDEPAIIKEKVAALRKEMDTVQGFLDDCCCTGPQCRVGASDLYQAYLTWADNMGAPLMTQAAFGRRLPAKGFQKTKQRFKGKHQVVYLGIRLSEEEAPNDGIPF